MKLKIAILAGDGIGPEVTHEATKLLRAVAS
jgi:3-isopropylmalate dehydrogenase